MSAVQQSRDGKAIVSGLLVIAAGLGIAAVGALDLVTLKIKNLVLPSFSMYVAALIVAGIGAALIVFSDRQRCATCQENMESEDAYFPLEAEARILQAVSEFNAAILAGIPMVPKNQMKSVVSLTWCPKCEAVGLIAASKWQDYQPHDLLPERQVSGPQVREFARMMKDHAEFRGDDE